MAQVFTEDSRLGVHAKRAGKGVVAAAVAAAASIKDQTEKRKVGVSQLASLSR